MSKNYTTHQLLILFFLFSTVIFSQTDLSNSPYQNIINTYLSVERENLNLLETDYQDIQINNEVFSKSTRITHLYLNQRYQGIPVYNAISNVGIKDNNIFNFKANFISDISNKVNVVSPVLNPEEAITAAANHFGINNLNTQLISEENGTFTYTSSISSRSNIPVFLVYNQNNNGSLSLAWNLSIQESDGKHWWSVRVDAINGEILDFNDWTLSCNFECKHAEKFTVKNKKVNSVNIFKKPAIINDGSTYNVISLPDESPNHGNFQLLSEPASLNASPLGWHDTDGFSGPEFTITRGNNVWAQEDVDGSNGTGYSPDGTNVLNFNFDTNLEQSPLGYQDTSLTNLFYLNNMMHDIWYNYGFDEASGNFQQNNYGNGGLGGDFVFADGQDGSGLNNATFGTPPDGGNPGMTMFLWSPSGPIGNPLAINNGILSGDYAGISAAFGGTLSSSPITADLVLSQDFTLDNVDANDACDLITNGAALNGKIAVIRRGQCEFGTKILAVENLGAIAVIMVNNEAGDPITMGAGADGGSVTIPAIMVSQSDGEAIIDELENGATLNASLIAAGPFQKDGSLDSGIVAHEYGHGISNRLTGGPSAAGCLNNTEQMGEGWSDWFALMVTMKATDIAETGRGVATYSIGQDISGGGIRPLPYSTNFSVNNATYADISNLSIPHGVGFVWATMLWDLTWAYVDKYGFDEDLINGTGGNNKVMQLVLDGLKLQPCNPGFVDGRDALLEADIALTGGVDQCLIWAVFAKRGLGFGADQGSPNNVNDQIENFDSPPEDDPSLENCSTLSANEFEINNYKIFPNPTNSELTIKVNKDFGEVEIMLIDINGREVYNTSTILNNQFKVDVRNLQEGLYVLKIKSEVGSINEKIIIN